MEKIAIKRESLSKAIEQLKLAIDLYNKIQQNMHVAQLRGGDEDEVVFQLEPLALATRESVIQRFEYTIDLFWKYLRLFLADEGVEIEEIKSPKNIMRKASQVAAITEDESKLLIKMIDDRNLSSHIYREEIAQQLISAIPDYYQLINKLFNQLS